MATVTILKITQVPAHEYPSHTDAFQAVIFAVKSGGVAYRWSKSPIDASFTSAQIQTLLNGESDGLFAEAQAAHNGDPTSAPIMTDAQITAGAYSWQHWANRDVFIAAYVTQAEGIRTATIPLSLANYRTILANTLTALSSLAGTPFETHLNNERSAQGLSGSISSFTLAQCNSFDNLIGRWVDERLIGVLWAKDLANVTE
jgi:hypothetical protein